MGKDQPQVSEQEYQDLEKLIFQPLENYRVGRNEITAGTVSPSYLLPMHGLQRLEKIMDEYVGGTSTNYMTNDQLLNRGLELLAMLKEDMNHMGAEDLHQLQRAWELHHRLLASESVTHHTSSTDGAELRAPSRSRARRSTWRPLVALGGMHRGQVQRC